MSGDFFSGKLLPGEQILWSGQPHQGLSFRIRDVLWYMFTLYGIWPGGFVSSRAPRAIKLLGLIAIGNVCAFIWALLQAYWRRQTHYAVTTSRILISQPMLKVQRKLGVKLRSISLGRLPEPMLKMGVKGQGTIFFERPILGRSGATLPSWTLMLEPAAKFAAINDSERILVLIQHAMDLA